MATTPNRIAANRANARKHPFNSAPLAIFRSEDRAQLCLDHAMEGFARPFILQQPELTNGIDIPLEQHRAYWLAFGFNRFTAQSNIAATLLRFPA